jgi:hypothetical protein
MFWIFKNVRFVTPFALAAVLAAPIRLPHRRGVLLIAPGGFNRSQAHLPLPRSALLSGGFVGE